MIAYLNQEGSYKRSDGDEYENYEAWHKREHPQGSLVNFFAFIDIRKERAKARARSFLEQNFLEGADIERANKQKMSETELLNWYCRCKGKCPVSAEELLELWESVKAEQNERTSKIMNAANKMTQERLEREEKQKGEKEIDINEPIKQKKQVKFVVCGDTWRCQECRNDNPNKVRGCKHGDCKGRRPEKESQQEQKQEKEIAQKYPIEVEDINMDTPKEKPGFFSSLLPTNFPSFPSFGGLFGQAKK